MLTKPVDADLRGFFLEQITAVLPKLQAALKRLDWPFIVREAHSLKGAGGSVGYPEISVWSESLEQAARAQLETEARRLVANLVAWQAHERKAVP